LIRAGRSGDMLAVVTANHQAIARQRQLLPESQILMTPPR
jgi:hypothetical protein